MVEAQRVRKEEAEMARHNANQALYQLVARVKDSTAEFPPLSAATSHRGLAPRPAQVSPDGPRYFAP